MCHFLSFFRCTFIMPVTEHTGPAYDFLAEDNYPRWYQLLQPFLRGVNLICSAHVSTFCVCNNVPTYVHTCIQLIKVVS